jgi:uncharacterized protein YjbI with pentapeptide repeats
MKLPLETKSKIKVLVDSNLYYEIFFGQGNTLELAGNLLKLNNSRQVIFYITEICLSKVLERLEKEEVIGNFSLEDKKLIKHIASVSINSTVETDTEIVRLTSQYMKAGSINGLSDLDAALELACVKSRKIGAIISESLNKYDNVNKSGVIVLTLKELYERIHLENLYKLDTYSLKIFNADLQGLDLTDKNLRGIDIRHSNLSNSNLSNSILSYSKLHLSNISNSNLSSSILMHSILWGVSFINSNLSKSNLSCADLSGADLCNSNLKLTNFWGAILNDSNLDGADLRGADLTKAQLNNASLVGTKFGNNLGIDEIKIKSYLQKGAIFS